MQRRLRPMSEWPTSNEHRFGFECCASTGLNTPETMFPTLPAAARRGLPLSGVAMLRRTLGHLARNDKGFATAIQNFKSCSIA
jgi:hypothetical protein